MWTGIKIEDVLKSIYGNFYSEHDIEIIRGDFAPDRKDVRRLINKAEKYGDTMTALALKDMYDYILYVPPTNERFKIPPRAQIEADIAVIMEAALESLLKGNNRG